MDKETLSNYGWIVICVLVLAVMIALATPFGQFVEQAVKSTTQGLFDVNKNALNNVNVKIDSEQFYKNPALNHTGVNFGDGRTTPQAGDIYKYGDYVYTYYVDDWRYGDGWNAQLNLDVIDKNQSHYGELLESINGVPLTSLNYTFSNTAVVESPKIPEGVISMDYTYQNCKNIEKSPIIPQSMISMHGTFTCSSIKEPPILPEGLQMLAGTFNSCTQLTVAPQIPQSATSIIGMFWGCSKLVSYVGSTDVNGDFRNYRLPTNITSLSQTFKECKLITHAPKIPNKVISTYETFFNCTNLIEAPILPDGIIDVYSMFYGCAKLKTYTGAPENTADGDFSQWVIPNGTENCRALFNYCNSLTKAPIIPESVNNVNRMFLGCNKLTGTIVINSSKITDCTRCLYNTALPIILTGNCTQLDEIVASAEATNGDNITIQ